MGVAVSSLSVVGLDGGGVLAEVLRRTGEAVAVEALEAAEPSARGLGRVGLRREAEGAMLSFRGTREGSCLQLRAWT